MAVFSEDAARAPDEFVRITGTPRQSAWTNVILLSLTQALSQSGSVIVMTVTALAGASLAGRAELATVPLALHFVAMAVAAAPAALLMGRYGRRTGLSAGQAIGAVSALVASYGIFVGQFWVFAAGSMGIGIHNAFWQQLRFAAVDAVDERHRSRAVSYVLAGGLVAAVVGPWLVLRTRDLISPATFAGCYLALAGLALLAILVLRGIRLEPSARSVPACQEASTCTAGRTPGFAIAVMSSSIAYGSMILLMTSTSPAILDHGMTLPDAAFVIQWHVLAMFAPSFFTGHLIDRFGVFKVIGTGALLGLLAMTANLTGSTLVNYWLGLVAIGISWNFMFVGGTSLLSAACRPGARARAQALNEFLMFGTVALASLLSGYLYAVVGWSGVNLALALPMLLILVSVARCSRKMRQAGRE